MSSLYFDKTWEQYKAGFDGNSVHESWIGLENLHQLTSNETWNLVIELEDWDNVTYKAKYETVTVEDEASKYALRLGAFDAPFSTLGDSLTYHNGMKFSTAKFDNDANSGQNGN